MILLIFSTIIIFSILTYNIFPKISSDTSQFKKNLEENTSIGNCLSAITSIDFIEYSNLIVNYSEYKYLVIYQPFHNKNIKNN